MLRLPIDTADRIAAAYQRRPPRCPVIPETIGAPVIVSGGGYGDRTVRVWRLADGTPLVPPLYLPESIRAGTVHGTVIVTAAGTNIAVHHLALPPSMR